jgi:hypothetical protein
MFKWIKKAIAWVKVAVGKVWYAMRCVGAFFRMLGAACSAARDQLYWKEWKP